MTTPPRPRKTKTTPAMGEPDLQAFFDALAPVRVGKNGYTAFDRYSDFRRTFFGSDSGKKVLSQIASLCEGRVTLISEVQDTHAMAYRAGMRYIIFEIAKWMNAEPPAAQERTEG